jgi:starvation-inducible DNA-binding protein
MSTDTLFSLGSQTYNERHKLADALNGLLADTFTLHLAYRNLDWNVSGPQFQMLRTMFEEQYREVQEALDEIAERIRAHGHRAASSYAEFLELGSIEIPNNRLEPMVIAGKIIDCHQSLAKRAQNALDIANEIKDVTTADLMSERISMHDKYASMLDSLVRSGKMFN